MALLIPVVDILCCVPFESFVVMAMTEPHQRPSSVFIATSMEIASKHMFLKRSFLLGLLGGASSSEVSPDSIIC